MEVVLEIVWAVGSLTCLGLFGYDLAVKGQKIADLDTFFGLVLLSLMFWWALIPLEIGERLGKRTKKKEG